MTSSDAYTVSELNHMLATAVGELTPEPIEITGTLVSWTRSRAWQRGELVTHEHNSVVAKLSLGCRARTGMGISRSIAATGQTLQTPVDVTITGHLHFHEKYGLRFHVISIDPESIRNADSGRHRSDLIAELEHSGLFSRQQQLTPPATIARIGLITPESGHAGRQDALDVLEPLRREVHERRIATANTKSSRNIVRAIEALEPCSDILVIVRGGGASSDLHVWDDYDVAHAIARCDVPIVVGVGHATDRHLARQVAWHGANTPTAAAEHVAQLVAPRQPRVAEVVPSVPPRELPVFVRPRMQTVHERRRRYVVIGVVLLVAAAIAAAYWFGLSR